MSRKLVERVSRVVDRRAGRRGFLRSSAMAATAMAVAPVAYAMRPDHRGGRHRVVQRAPVQSRCPVL